MRYKLYSLLAIAVIVSSCHKQVLEIKPENLLSSDLAFSTPQKIESVVLASYDGLQSAEFISGRVLVYVDLMGEDIFDRTNYFGDLPRYSLLANSGIASNVWTAGYSSVARANRAMAGIHANISKLTDAKAKELIAECKFVRAVANFYMVNLFGQPYAFTSDASHPGIPLITQSFTSNDAAANQPRSSVGAIYTAVITDLTEALADLPLEYDELYHTKTRGTKAAAASFLSRVYLYKGDYANAKKYSLDVINGNYGTYALNSTVDAAFLIANDYQTEETIWSIPNNVNDNPNTNNALPMHYHPKGRGDLPVSTSFLSITTNPYFTADDKRRGMIIPGDAATSTTAYKFTSKYTDITSRADWAPILRYAEVLLNYAEAQARTATGVDADAVAKLNLVRDRAKGLLTPSYTTGSFANKDLLIAAILGERRIELAFEGHRFWDLMRIKATVTNKYDSDGTTLLPTQVFGAKKNIFPIPQIEIDKSKRILVQNDGY